MLRPGIDAPVWTKDPPTQPGLYWFSLRTKDRFEGGVVRNCRVWFARPYGGDEKQLVAEGADGKLLPVAQFQRWWAGYLPEPIE